MSCKQICGMCILGEIRVTATLYASKINCEQETGWEQKVAGLLTSADVKYTPSEVVCGARSVGGWGGGGGGRVIVISRLF